MQEWICQRFNVKKDTLKGCEHASECRGHELSDNGHTCLPMECFSYNGSRLHFIIVKDGCTGQGEGFIFTKDMKGVYKKHLSWI